MALPVNIPNFIAADNTLLTAFNAAFYNLINSMWIQNNGAAGNNGGGLSLVGYSDPAFLADQYAEATIKALDPGSSTYVGVAVRCGAAASGNGYAYMTPGLGNAFLLSLVGGAFNVIGTGAILAVGDVIRIEAVGNVITPKVNGVVADIGPVVDNTFATGMGGLSGFRSSTIDTLGSFRTGNIGGPPPAVKPGMFLPFTVPGL